MKGFVHTHKQNCATCVCRRSSTIYSQTSQEEIACIAIISRQKSQVHDLPPRIENLRHVDTWHFIGKRPIWSKWSYCQGRVVWALSKHLRQIPSPIVENLLRKKHLKLKNEKSEDFKMLRNQNSNIFSLKKSISSSCM